MNVYTLTKLINIYKECPNCGASYKGDDMRWSLKNEVVTISCTCGFLKKVDRNNNEVK